MLDAKMQLIETLDKVFAETKKVVNKCDALEKEVNELKVENWELKKKCEYLSNEAERWKMIAQKCN